MKDAVDIIICPPAVDNLSDTDEIDEQQLHGSMPRDVPGTVELHHSDSVTDEAVDDDEWCDQGNPTFTKFQQPLSDMTDINADVRTNSEEVWIFISILILSGYNNLPQQ